MLLFFIFWYRKEGEKEGREERKKEKKGRKKNVLKNGVLGIIFLRCCYFEGINNVFNFIVMKI